MEKYISKYIGNRRNRLGHRQDIKVAFDVDHTLIDENDRPIYHNINLLLWFVDRGYNIIVWSGGGFDYCSHVVRKLGLEDIVEVLEKGCIEVDIAFDDQAINLGKVNIEV